MKKNLCYWLILCILTLYSPVELTRILLLIRQGYVVSLPNYWVFEIIAIWLGFSTGVLLLKLFGFTLEAKRESRWVSRDEFTALLQALQDIQDKLEALEKRAEANRVRISQVASAKNTNEAEQILTQGKQAVDPIQDILKKFGG